MPYEESEHAKELLRLWVKGEREIETGQGYDLDTVLSEADALLAKENLRLAIDILSPELAELGIDTELERRDTCKPIQRRSGLVYL